MIIVTNNNEQHDEVGDQWFKNVLVMLESKD